MRSAALIVLVLTSLGFRGANLPPRDQNGKFDIHWFTAEPYLPLAAGASIYECEAVAKATEGSYPRAERGSVTLRVTRTLYGTPQDRLVVPYWLPGASRFSEDPLPWSDSKGGVRLGPTEIPGARLCVVFLPGAYDPQVGEVAGSDGAVSIVERIKGDDDPALQGWVEIARLHSLPPSDVGLLTAELISALDAASPRVRRYARRSLVGRLSFSEPAAVTTALRRWVETTAASNKPELTYEATEAFELLAELTHWNGYPFTTETLAMQALARAASYRPTALRDQALAGLASCAQTTTLNVTDVLGPAERTQLLAVLKKAASDDPSAWHASAEKQRSLKAVQAWIAAAKVPPAAQPASHALRYALGALLFVSSAALVVRRQYLRRLRRRRSRNLCEFCGYDLRASQARCPECGQDRRG